MAWNEFASYGHGDVAWGDNWVEISDYLARRVLIHKSEAEVLGRLLIGLPDEGPVCPTCEGTGELKDAVQAWDEPGAPIPECEACSGTGRLNGQPIIYDIGVVGGLHPPDCPQYKGTGKTRG